MSHELWTLPKVEAPTPLEARALVEECFVHAQRETFARARERIGASDQSPEALQRAVVGAVRAAFREVGADYDAPDHASLVRVVELLARKAGAWGTPEDVIAHHGAQLRDLLSRVP